MRTLFFLFFTLWSTFAWSQEWHHGFITQQISLDQGGFHVEVDGIRYLIMRDAKIHIDSVEHEVPDRMTYITTKSKVRILREGLRIYAIELEWRNYL